MSNTEIDDRDADETLRDNQIRQQETFVATIESTDDVNEATRKFNSAVNKLRERADSVTLNVAVVEVEHGQQ